MSMAGNFTGIDDRVDAFSRDKILWKRKEKKERKKKVDGKHCTRWNSKKSNRPTPMSQYACAEATAAAKVKKSFIENSEEGSELKKRQKGRVEEKLG